MRLFILLLHAAIDTAMMGRLGVVATLHDIDRCAYADLQDRVFQELGDSKIHSVQWDDVIWRRLARSGVTP